MGDTQRGLVGAVSIVIGGSEGIGQAVAEALAAQGAKVVIGGRDEQRLERAARSIADSGVSIAGLGVVDITSESSICDFVDQVQGRHGPPQILVNSAGYSVTKPAFDVTVDDWDAVHAVQVRGPFLTCREVGRLMADQGYGKIVNVSSTWSVTTSAGRSVYGAAKAGLNHLTAALAVEWAPLGIRVNAVAPTATLTPTIERRFEQDPTRAEYLRRGIPLGRLAAPKDIVGSVVFLASPDSDFVTGHTLFVDGGWRFAK